MGAPLFPPGNNGTKGKGKAQAAARARAKDGKGKGLVNPAAEANKRIAQLEHTNSQLRANAAALKAAGKGEGAAQEQEGEPETPGDTTTWREELDGPTIQVETTAFCEKHFAQAQGTPFTIDPLQTLIGPHGTSDAATEILNGIHDIEQYPILAATKELLRQLEHPPDLKNTQDIPHNLSTEDVQECYKHWGEGTSTSPSGRHLGHYRALFSHLGLPTDSDDPTATFQACMLAIDTLFLNICITHGYAVDT